MSAAIATLVLGVIIGYVGQRSRLCFIAGYRDYLIARDLTLLKGIAGAFIGAGVGFIGVGVLGGQVPAFPYFAEAQVTWSWTTWVVAVVGGIGVGVVATLSDGCPYRMHVLAAEGHGRGWFYLGGLYLGIVFYNLVTGRLVGALAALP